jgi:DNA processing protein
MSAALPTQAYAAALTAVAGIGPRRLRALLARLEPVAAWHAVLAGTAFGPANGEGADGADGTEGTERAGRADGADATAAIAAQAARVDPAEVWRWCRSAGIGVTVLGHDSYPAILADDIAPPAVLFYVGDLGVLHGPRVAVVGTRNATSTGCDVAAQLGHELATAGVRVVSGLARGIDGWAHRGAIEADAAPPIGVVGSGLDWVYPSHHRDLWRQVTARGVLLSEVPPRTPPRGHHFPARNRIIAGVADAVVVVESRAAGGSLHTVEEASRRGITVLAVPGSVRNPAAEGTNRLIADGATPVTDVADVLVALGLDQLALSVPRRDRRARPGSADAELLAHLRDTPTDIDALVQRCGWPALDVALALGRLESGGWVIQTGAWFEAVP